MQILKEERAGALYLMSMYSAGVLRRQPEHGRRERKKLASERKQKINALKRKYGLMQLMGCNFSPGRDLFVYLGWAQEPDEAGWRAAMRRFHRRMEAAYKRFGAVYKYILVTERHTRAGEPCRVHHHLIISGCGRRALELISRCWGNGSVDVRTLRELTDNFEDTCRYLLKEDKPKGERAYSCSQNLRRPEEPLRRRRRESEAGEVPPGVKVVTHEIKDNEFGRYEILVGKIVDAVAFDRYWAAAQRDRRRVMEAMHWRREADRKRRKKQQAKKPAVSQERASNISP